MIKIKMVLILFAFFTFYACGSLVVKSLGLDNAKAEVTNLQYEEKEIALIPMHHVGKKEFYADVRSAMDSLLNDGYYVMVEGVGGSSLDMLTSMKLRKLGLIGLVNKNHLDTVTNKIGGKINVGEGYINQPDWTYFNLNSTNSENIDIPISQLLKDFETDYGEIPLDECDYQTPIGSYDYKCDLLDKHKRKFFMADYVIGKRNTHLLNSIKNSKHKKIVIPYGRVHTEFIQKNLK